MVPVSSSAKKRQRVDMSSVLTVQGLRYATRQGEILRGVSLELMTGAVTIVVGPNGAGKSTLLRTLAGGLRPSAGRVVLGGALVSAIPSWRLACMRAVMAQSATVAMPFSAFEIVRLGCENVGRSASCESRIRMAWAALEAADASPLAHRLYATLSGGERARVQFARALCQLSAGATMTREQILFLDEPTAALDLRHQSALMRLARTLAARGVAVFAILHDINLAAAYADQLVVLDAGRIAAAGPPSEVMDPGLLSAVFQVEFQFQASPRGKPFLHVA
jgi:iron complex transport system ATP-binding protein